MRFTAALLLAALLAQVAAPSAALAMSTSAEIARGQELSKQVDRESMLVDDPFLNNWVNTVGGNLANFRARPDITYRFEIINSDEINAFALPGGFVHVDMGLLNSVSSDDELAGVMAHEMGHVERRHVVTLEEKNTILGVLIGVLSILSPIAYALGGYGGDLAMNKFSRQDELQADQYGLLLMSRAGYDPQSMVDFMDYLRQQSQEQPESKADKAFQDHPVPSDRIAHLEGYPELDNPSAEQITADAIHDQNEGRYSYAQARLMSALKKDPNDTIAMQHLTAVQVALKSSGPHAAADTHTDDSFALDPAGRAKTAALVATAANIARDDAALAKEQAKYGGQDAQSLFTQLNSLAAGVPNLGHPKRPDNDLAVASAALDHVVQDVNGTLGLTSDVTATVPGLLNENLVLLKEMADPLRDESPTPASQSLLQYYPSIAAQLTISSDELTRAVDRSRAAVTSAADAVGSLKDFFIALDSVDMTSGDIPSKDWPRVRAAMQKAVADWDDVKGMALRADDEVYAAQTRWLSARTSLLDLTSSPERYNGFRKALGYRFPGVAVPDYAAASRLGVPPGEIGCSAWLSYETKEPIQQILDRAQAAGENCIDAALSKGLLTESMEIAAGLVYQDYVDKPHPIK